MIPTFAPTVRPEDVVDEVRALEFAEEVVLGVLVGIGAVDIGAVPGCVINVEVAAELVDTVGNDVELELGSTVFVTGIGSSAKLYPVTRNPVTVIPPSPVVEPCRAASVPDKLLTTIFCPAGTVEMHLLSDR